MTKKENEFTKVVDDLDRKVSEINDRKKTLFNRELKLQKTIDKKNEEKKRFIENEAKEAKIHSQKTKIWIILSYGTVAFWILSIFYKKDPVDFWFHVIVAICYVGFYFMAKHSK